MPLLGHMCLRECLSAWGGGSGHHSPLQHWPLVLRYLAVADYAALASTEWSRTAACADRQDIRIRRSVSCADRVPGRERGVPRLLASSLRSRCFVRDGGNACVQLAVAPQHSGAGAGGRHGYDCRAQRPQARRPRNQHGAVEWTWRVTWPTGGCRLSGACPLCVQSALQCRSILVDKRSHCCLFVRFVRLLNSAPWM
jgi:hypothetical protein